MVVTVSPQNFSFKKILNDFKNYTELFNLIFFLKFKFEKYSSTLMHKFVSKHPYVEKPW